MAALYLHVKVDDARSTDVLAAASAEKTRSLPKTQLSVNTKLDGSQAIIKLAHNDRAFLFDKEFGVALIASYTEKEHAEVLALIAKDPAWYPAPDPTPIEILAARQK